MKKRGVITLLVIFGGLFFGLMIFIGILVAAFSPDGFGETQEGIGVVEVEGSIMESKETLEQLRSFEDNDAVKAVVVRVNSPGGAVAPSQEIFSALKRLREKKPLAVSMGTVAASGGYYIACGSEMIFANPGTITGSIGVITQVFNVDRLVERLDVEVNTITSGEFKDAGSPFRPFEESDRIYFDNMVQDIHQQFVEDVAECRGMEMSEANRVADGRVFTGRQALDLNLVDRIGSMHDAVEYLAEEVGMEDPALIYPPEERLGVMAELFQVAVKSTVTEAQDQTRTRVMYKYTGPQ